MTEMVRERVDGEYIEPQSQWVATNTFAIFQWAWEATHGPREPWPGTWPASAWRFLQDLDSPWPRLHAIRRPNAPEHVLNQFFDQVRGSMSEIPIDDIMNADEKA
jgi:hypothetical protein